jgi:hypothetical protein
MKETVAALVVVLALAAPARGDDASPPIPKRLAVQTESCFGVVTGPFYNQLVGARLDASFSPHVSFGGGLSYANLKGKDGREHSALVLAQVEYLFGAPGANVRFPLRFASGYLGGNGPIARASFGFDFALTPKVDLVTELVTPTVWLTNSQTLLSMDVAVELAFRL